MLVGLMMIRDHCEPEYTFLKRNYSSYTTMAISSISLFKDQITGVDEPEQEAPEDRPLEFYAPLVSTRHIDPKYGLTYQTVDIKEKLHIEI